MARAVRLCPQLVIVPPRYRDYRAASQLVRDRLYALTPLVEPLSIDEAFLEVTELPEPGEQVAKKLQQSIREELGLPCSLGVASNKLVAKIATDVGKTAVRTDGYPNALRVVPPGREAAFLAPLPVQALWGVGPKTAERLQSLGLQTIGDIARFAERKLVQQFGRHGHDLFLRARGIDTRAIVTHREAKSISKETTFAQDIRDETILRQELLALAQGVGQQLRHEGLSGATVKLKLRWPDFTTLTRQTTLCHPTDADEVIAGVSGRLFEAVWCVGKPVRLLGVCVAGLEPAGGGPFGQLILPDLEGEGVAFGGA
jgi:DNA polymerase-4